MSIPLEDINELLGHSFKDETLRNEVWKDFYALLPPPLGIGYDEDFLNYLDGAFKINQKKIDLTNIRGKKEYFKGLQAFLPITKSPFFIRRTSGHCLNLEWFEAVCSFEEKFLTSNNLESHWARIEDDSLPLDAKVIRMVIAYK